jgi:hypothetical protein
MCGTDWDDNDDMWLFPPGCCCWRVARAEEKGGGNRVVCMEHRGRGHHLPAVIYTLFGKKYLKFII